MTPWTLLDTAIIPNGGGELKLAQRGDEFSIRLSGIRGELMNSRVFGSEQALADLGCERIKTAANARVLVGGLGMGYTLAAALNTVSDSATVTVAELIPEVVKWNQGDLGKCAGRPLDDKRSRVYLGDVAELFEHKPETFDAILLDVDNGPEGLTQSDNHWLYSLDGLKAIYQTLSSEGRLAIWSAGPDSLFVTRLKKAKFNVSVRTVRARAGKGSRHTIFLAQKGLAIF